METYHLIWWYQRSTKKETQRYYQWRGQKSIKYAKKVAQRDPNTRPVIRWERAWIYGTWKEQIQSWKHYKPNEVSSRNDGSHFGKNQNQKRGKWTKIEANRKPH